MTLSSPTAFFLGSRFTYPPWYMRHCVAIFMGTAALWIVFSGEEFHLKYSTEPLPNQLFYRVCFAVLGVSMIGLSLWGLWLHTP